MIERTRTQCPNTHRVPRTGPSEGMDPLLVHEWDAIAALAWRGYMTEGRGTVIATVVDGHTYLTYWPEVPCDCHARWVNSYDPNDEAIVVVRRDGGEAVYRLSASPAPPEAFATEPLARGLQPA